MLFPVDYSLQFGKDHYFCRYFEVKMEETKQIRIEDFDYLLEDDRIAKYPLSQRDHSRLLVYKEGIPSEDLFYHLPQYLPSDTLLVFNNTKVIQARIHFRKSSGALIEIFCLEPYEPKDYAMAFSKTSCCTWVCMIGNLKKWKEGALEKRFEIAGETVLLRAEKKEQVGNHYRVEFSWDTDHSFAAILDEAGELPIPPYLNRETEEKDKETYQTVYSKIKGSVAAPTAGLHFTESVLLALREKGVKQDELTLHVGAGTFKPVKSETIAGHDMHIESFSVTRSLVENLITYTGKVCAVGTTSVRTLESLYYIGAKIARDPSVNENDLWVKQWEPYDEPQPTLTTQAALTSLLRFMEEHGLETLHTATQIILVPGYRFKLVNVMVTNFHQPKSTLLLLVSAFVGGDWRTIYRYALDHGFRFLSYGDSSILFPPHSDR